MMVTSLDTHLFLKPSGSSTQEDNKQKKPITSYLMKALMLIKFTKPLVNNIIFAESERYLPDEYLHPYEPSQMYQTNSKNVSFIESYKCPELVDLEIKVSSDQNGQADQNDQTDQNDQHAQTDEISNDDQFSRQLVSGTKGIKLELSSKNKARLVAQGYNQQVGINYDETFVPIARLEAIKIFLAFATYMNLIVYQMDVKSKFLNGFDLKGYSYSNYAGCNMDRKSTSGTCQLLKDKLVCWSAKKQQYVAMSSAKAEYVAADRCCANILWMKSQLTDYDILYEKVPIFCNNTCAISNFKQSIFALKGHIDIRYHFIRDHILKGDIELHFIPTQYQLANIFTKPLDKPTFKRLIIELGMLNIDSKPEPSVLTKEN
ncbi:retrovirus-related pol polyprotein from transposon TNT 1-94 [Tanacetum coccineum]